MSGGPSNTTTTQKTELPAWLNQHAQTSLSQVQSAAGQPYQPYTGQTVAPLNAQQLQALGLAQADIGSYKPTLSLGDEALAKNLHLLDKGVASPTPQSQMATATAGNVAGSDLNPYLNPYTQNVIDTSLGSLDRTRQQQLAGNAAQATAAGAFGGSRSAVLDSLTNEAALRESGSLAANLNSANFTQAQQALINDLNRQAQTSQFNAAQTQQNNQFNAGQQQQQIQNYFNAAGMFGDATSTAGQLGSIKSGLAGADIQRLLGIGNQIQDDTQFGLDKAYQEFLRQQGDPLSKALAYAGAVGGTNAGSTSSATTPLTRNRTASALGGAATGAGVGSTFGPWGTAIGGLVGGAYGYFG